MTTRGVFDLHLHDAVSVRLVDATRSDVEAVVRDSGLAEGRAAGDPDITITYVDELDVGRLRLLGAEAAACDQGYVTFAPKHRGGGRSLVPLDRVGGPCRIVCERGAGGVPMLLDILNLTAVHRGLLPLHGVAFRLHDLGWVLTGWSKGGKTSTLLGVAARGATVVGDDWVYLRGGEVLGTAHRMRLSDWQLRQAPHVRSRLTPKQRRRLRVASALTRLHQDAGPALRRSLPYKALTQVMSVVEEHNGVYVAPAEVFPSGVITPRSAVDRLVLVESVNARATRFEPVAPGLVADRMAASLEYERSDLRAAWTRYRFAEPGARNLWLEQVGELERTLLHAAFEGVPTYRLEHPYPGDLSALADAIDALA